MDWVYGIMIGAFSSGMFLLAVILLYETSQRTQTREDAEVDAIKEKFRDDLKVVAGGKK